jgi:serine/threonine protein kinase
MMAQLSHQNVLAVYEVGLADDGAVFVVMEHIDGSDLRAWLAQPRSVAAIQNVFAPQAGRGLAAAHAAGDRPPRLRPDNVLIGADGRVRVADFGLSRLSTKPAALVRIDDGGGTPRYMAPELWRGSPATVASDVFAFCIAAADALAGEPVAPELVDRDLRERGVSPRLRELLVAGMSPGNRRALARRGARRARRPRVVAPEMDHRRLTAAIVVGIAI